MNQLFRALFLCAVLVGYAAAQKGGAQGEHTHPAPGTSIKHFAQINEGVYKGSKPKNDADYRFLRSKRIRYIVDLKFFSCYIDSKRARLKSMG